MKAFFKNNLLLLSILLLYLFVALYKLDTIPAEIWGDAISHYYLAQNVLHGHFFYNYAFGGDGPIFTYIAVAVSFFTPLSFNSLKLTAVIIGFFFILSMYFLAKEFFKEKEIALLSATISAISFWTIVFARQPHARILVPLFICLALIYTLKKKNVIVGILLGMGMYTQASFWGMIFSYWRNWKTLLIGIILILPLIYSFIYSPIGFFTKQSYFGEKLAVHTPFSQAVYAILFNIQANLLSFNFKGDRIFRMNIPYHPHLDFVSGILFVIGFLLILYHNLPETFVSKLQKYFGYNRVSAENRYKQKVDKKTIIVYFILPFFVIQIPSFLDIHNYYTQPNISRMIGVIPFVYMSVAYAIFILNNYLTAKVKTKTAKKLITLFVYYGIIAVIFVLNFYNYFIVYPRTLPNGNTPFGKLIADAIDTSDPNTKVFIIGAGWGQYAQPEVAGIPMVQKTVHPEYFSQNVLQAQESLCQNRQKDTPILIASDPENKPQLDATNLCITKTKSYMLRSNGFDVAYIIEGRQ